MKIVADENIPMLEGVLEPYAEVMYAAGNAITSESVRDADALLIRTRTHCDEKLLKGSSVKFIGTATIGTDHIDLDYCRQKNIAVYSAAGCNAAAVMQYIITSLFAFHQKTEKKLSDCTLGIIGVGNVGGLVNKTAQVLGMHVLLNDPPREVREDSNEFISLDKLLNQSDIITIHVPLTAATENLACTHFFEKMKPYAAFINTSRGEVVDEEALLKHRSRMSFVVLDVWRNEPRINQALLAAVDIATPHIAGYSVQGKCNATSMLVQAIAQFFQIEQLRNFCAVIEPKNNTFIFSENKESLSSLICKTYAIFEDDKLLRAAPEKFEQLRNQYKLRNDFSGCCIELEQASEKTRNILKQLGANVTKL